MPRTDSSRMLMGYLGLLHSQYFYYLYAETLSPQPLENLIILLLNSRYYLTISIENSWNPPTVYLALANIEYELNTLKSNGILSSSVSVNFDLMENYLLSSIKLNDHLVNLSSKGIPVQDLIDSYTAYNQLGVYYMTKSDHIISIIQKNENIENITLLNLSLQDYIEKSENTFFKCISMHPLRYESRLNLGTLYLRQNRNEEALKIFQDTIQLFLDKESIPFIVWNNLGIVQEKLQKYIEARESYINALNILEIKNVKDHPSYETVRMNLKKIQMKIEKL